MKGDFDCEWMNNPGPLQNGSNWCPIHPEDKTAYIIRHGWYHYTPEEHVEVCKRIAENKRKQNETMQTL